MFPILRYINLRRHRSRMPEGMLPFSELHQVLIVIDLSDSESIAARDLALSFFEQNKIKTELLYIDLASSKSRSQVDMSKCITRKSLLPSGRPFGKHFKRVMSMPFDMLLCLSDRNDFCVRWICVCSKARFKIGRVQFKEKPFSIVMNSTSSQDASYGIMRKLVDFLPRIK